MTTEQAWDRYARYYDGYVKGFREDTRLYLQEAKPHEPILEVGCGTGRVLRAFLERGHRCVGLDISQAMLGHARINLKTWLNGPGLKMARHDLMFGKYQTAATLGLVTWFTFNFITDHPERFMSHLRDSLFIRHRVIIDCFYPKSMHHGETDGMWIEGAILHNGKHMAYRDRKEFRKGIETRTQVFLGPDGEETVETRRRYYSPKEMEALLTAAGYTGIEFCPGYSGEWSDEIKESDLRENYLVMAMH